MFQISLHVTNADVTTRSGMGNWKRDGDEDGDEDGD